MASPYTQEVRPLRVTTPLRPNRLLPVALTGEESISRLFVYQLEVLAEIGTPVPFDQLLGQKVTIELGPPNETPRYFSGVCSRISQGRRDQTFTAYRLEVVPQLWFLTRIRQSRIFQQLSVPQILAQVFRGLDVQLRLNGRYEPRDYCVQYRESDFDFASRLMEEEGIFYYFVHTAGGHTLVAADSSDAFPELPAPLIFDEEFTGGNRDEERLGTWEKSQELRSGKVTLWDHCFELPHKHLEADRSIQESVAIGTVDHKMKLAGSNKLELYDYPGGYAQRFDGVDPSGGDRPNEIPKIFEDNYRTVSLRMQEEAAAGIVAHGSGNVRALTCGHRFHLTRHFDADGEYLLTRVRHAARLTAHYRSGDQEAFQYASTFDCIPAALPFRPARTTPRPTVRGSQTAVVVGPPGEEIFTDKYGRVKVQFHWDRQGQNNADSSCWIRVASIWAGKNWGAIHIPRIGQEVIVDFLEGDPDRPIIVGSVYNADMMPPYPLPRHKTQSGVKSRSSLGGTPENFNEIRFEDQKGAEQLLIHAEKNQDIEVENDETHWVGHDRAKTIGHDETTHVKHDRTETVDNNESITIGANRTETVGKNESISVGGGRTVSVSGNDGLSVGKNLNIEAADSITLTTGMSQIVMKKDGTITIKGKSLTISMMKDVAIDGMTEIQLTSLGQVNVQGTKVGITASALASITGAVVKVN